MSMYLCNRCDTLKDNDWDVGEEDPKNLLELMCQQCTADAEDDFLEPVRGDFTQKQKELGDQTIADAREPA